MPATSCSRAVSSISTPISTALGTGAGQVQVPSGNSGFSANGADVAVTITNGGSPISWGGTNFIPAALSLNKAGSTNTLTLNADFSMDNAGTVQINGGTVVMNSAFSGAANLNFIGSANVIVLNGNSTYSGTAFIGAVGGSQSPAPFVRLTNANALGTGTISIAPQGNGSTGRLELAGGINVANPIAFQGRNTNTDAIENISGNNTLSGPLQLNVGGGTFIIQSDANTLTLSGASAVANGTALTSNAGGSRFVTLQGAGNGNISGAITNGTAVSLAIIKAGTGQWTLSGSATYAGLTTVKNGTLELGTNAQTPVLSNTPGGADVQGGRLVFDYTGATIAPTINGAARHQL